MQRMATGRRTACTSSALNQLRIGSEHKHEESALNRVLIGFNRVLTAAISPPQALQHILAMLISSPVSKLRAICSGNGLDTQGDKRGLIERLVDHIASEMRAERARR